MVEAVLPLEGSVDKVAGRRSWFRTNRSRQTSPLLSPCHLALYESPKEGGFPNAATAMPAAPHLLTQLLGHIDLDIPRNQLVVIPGLSGLGKSSPAFDTLYAEGQRRYVESLSTCAPVPADDGQSPTWT